MTMELYLQPKVTNIAAMEMEYSQHMPPDFLIPPSGCLSPLPLPSQVSTPQPRKTRLKRPHTKSRQGCYNCKSRRVKCQETKPACANCIHRDIDCLYPTEDRERVLVVANQTYARIQKQSTSASPSDGHYSSSTLSASPRISTSPFTGDDLRFWHHFLMDARPHLPFGDEATWLSTIPAFAHDCPHLLHAMLSLGASHCSLITPRGHQYAPTAIAYRSKALRSLSTILAKGDECTVLEMDGALATCYTLTFQAHHMSDGVVDFAVMVRGCGLVTNWYFQKSRESQIFHIQSREHMSQMINSWLPNEMQPLHKQETIEACIASLDKLQPLLQSPAHFTFYNTLRTAYESLLLSHRHAFGQLVVIYAEWAAMDNLEFLTFIAPGNLVSRALFMHYITIDCFMKPLYAELMKERNIGSGGGHFLIYRWAEAIYNGLPQSMQDLIQVPLFHLALDMILEVEIHRRLPQWNHELPGFIEWLRRIVPSEVLEMYNV
ncbi:hypothetical protein BJX76DRAFT_349916 [Aspergillus varians]